MLGKRGEDLRKVPQPVSWILEHHDQQGGPDAGGEGHAGPTPAPTLAEVARLAKVSTSTASRALSGQGKLRAETRQRVREAAAALGFQPSPYARGLVRGRTFTVGLITDDGFGRFSIPVLLGAEDALGAGQMALFFCDSRDDPIRQRHYVSMLVARHVDGLIVTGRVTDVRPAVEVPLSIPVVYAVIRSANEADICVTYDDEAGGRVAVEHLIAMGRRRIAHVTGPRQLGCHGHRPSAHADLDRPRSTHGRPRRRRTPARRDRWRATPRLAHDRSPARCAGVDSRQPAPGSSHAALSRCRQSRRHVGDAGRPLTE
jgi:Bacterial regulatory proteins, lacI family